MASKLKYIQDVAFVNRTDELAYLTAYLKKRPSEMLFLYGPKSGGKTTLLHRLSEQLDKEKVYEIKLLNLREIWIGNYKDFIRTFLNG